MVSPGTLNLAIIRGITFDARVLQLADESVTVSGTLVPNVTGTFVPCGTYAAYPLFILAGSPATFLYFNTSEGSYVIARSLTNSALTDYWSPLVALTEPTGTYLPHGANTGTATATDHPVDLTGYTVETKVRRTAKSEEYIDLLATVTDATSGTITIPAITKANTLALENIGDFQWDLVLNQGGVRSGPYVKGSFTISDNISQISVPPA